MKRYIAFSLSLIMMLFCIVPVPVSALSSALLAVGSVEGRIGDEVVVPISLDHNPGFVSMSLSVTYDTSALTLISCEYTDLIRGSVHSANYISPYQLTWENDILTSNITATGTIVYLTFLVNEDAREQDYSVIVRIPEDGILDANGNEVLAESAMGTITVAERHECVFGDWEEYSAKKHVRYCEECDEKEFGYHEWDEGVVVQAPSCEEAGITRYTCDICGATDEETVESVEHDYDTIVTAPTCTEDGYTTYVCDCGDSYVGSYVDALGHEWNTVPDRNLSVLPTCMRNGKLVYTCKNDCGECIEESVERKHHENAAGEDLEFCGTQTTDRKCCICGSYIAAVEHIYGEAVVTEPTFESGGYTTYTCCVCGDSSVSDYTDPLDPETAVHVEVGSVTGKAGDTVEVILTLKNAPALRALGIGGITYDANALTLISGEWLVEGALLADWNGSNHTAAAAYTQNTDLNGAIFKLIFQINENAEAGDYSIGCTVTAKEKSGAVETVVPVATVSGCISVKDYVVGDMDGNDMLDTDDAIYLLYYTLFGEDLYPIGQGCDFDGNGMVDTDDAIYLLYHTLFGDSMYPLN